MEWDTCKLRKRNREYGKKIAPEMLKNQRKPALDDASWQPLKLSHVPGAGQGGAKQRRLNSTSIGVLARREMASERRLS